MRDTLAGHFASAIAEAIQVASDRLAAEVSESEDVEEKKILREASTLLLVEKADIANRLAGQFRERFDAKLQPEEGSFGKTAKFSLDSLSLMDDFQMQEEIALGHGAKQIKERSGHELFALTQRLCALRGIEDIQDDDSPVYPRVFGRALLEALPKCAPAMRLKMLKSFQPALLDIVPASYAAANAMLVERGILVEIKSNYGKPVIKTSRGIAQVFMQGAAPAGAVALYPAGVENNEILGTLNRLFSQAGGAGIPGANAAPAFPAAAHAVPGTVTVQIRPELLAALRQIESRLPEFSSSSSATRSPIAISDEVQGSLFAAEDEAPTSNAVRAVRQELKESLTPADLVVTDIVATIFDRLFGDPRLPDSIKALLARLQIPVLKMAMLDRTIFSDPHHPLRAFIDRLVEFGIAQSASLQSGAPSLVSLAGIVNDVVGKHDTNHDALQRGYGEIEKMFHAEEEVAVQADESVQALVETEAKETAEAAASHIIAARLGNASYPQAIAEFVQAAWRKVLALDYLEGGPDGGGWKHDLQALDDLLWSIVPHHTRGGRKRLVEILPALLKSMNQGIARIKLDPAAGNAFFEELKTLHTHLVRLPVSEESPDSVFLDPNAAQQNVPYDDPETTIRSTGEKLVDLGLWRGAWLEFDEPDGARQRCRLSWLSPIHGVCLFKNYEKSSSFAISLKDLKTRLAGKTVRVVEGLGIARSSIEGAIQDVAQQSSGMANESREVRF